MRRSVLAGRSDMFRIAYAMEFWGGGHVFSHADDRKNPAAEDEKRHAHHEEYA